MRRETDFSAHWRSENAGVGMQKQFWRAVVQQVLGVLLGSRGSSSPHLEPEELRAPTLDAALGLIFHPRAGPRNVHGAGAGA